MYCECMYLASLSQKELAQFGEISRHRAGSPRGLVLVRAPPRVGVWESIGNIRV